MHFAKGIEVAAAIRSGKVKSLDVLEMFIQRIEKYDKAINAVVCRDFENARKKAVLADEATARGESWGVLHGVPMTVKENNDVVGMDTTIGHPERAGKPAQFNAVVCQRLVDAGAILFGKTNLPIDCNDIQTYNEVYGTTNNPYDLTRTPGGSSGGSAAALAAGFTPLEIGGDIGGSIRTPSHSCGLFGLKPTFDIICRHGGTPITAEKTGGDPSGIAGGDLVTKGPLARCPEDLSLLMDVIAGSHGREASGWTLNLPKDPPKQLKDYKIAIWGDDSVSPVDDDIKAAVQKVTNLLKASGATVTEAKPDFDSKDMFETYLTLLASAETVGETQEQAARAQKESLEATDDSDLSKQKRWIAQSHYSWFQAHAHRMSLGAAWERFFASYDFVITPVINSVAPPHQHKTITDMPFWKVGDRLIKGKKHRYPLPQASILGFHRHRLLSSVVQLPCDQR
eukprot:TRINITY_DN4707_c0_g1_i1.p1 TRINITY_DN4707_c0_g1~~TRINITY_DN4707_c0_g1_i1.p1  ORF type:complete len:454 (+),score=94.06 TRINITY_DN4707_c0_g1_i1:60-1421(+)